MQNEPSQHLFIFGLGYSAHYFADHYGQNWRIKASVRTTEKALAMRASGINTFVFGPDDSDEAINTALSAADVVLISIPPGDDDPVLRCYEKTLLRHPPRHIIYLSTIGVYGDHAGAWVDEATPPQPLSRRSQQRLAAERAWLALAEAAGAQIDILRLAGIYGPQRNVLENLRLGHAKRIIKAGQVFNRIHVEDIARTISACLERPHQRQIWNVSDDEPAPPQDVVSYGATLLHCAPPPAIDFDDAVLSPMARSFYSENKRVSNQALRHELGVALAFPSYREGLRALADQLRPSARMRQGDQND